MHRPKLLARVAGAEDTRRVNTDPFGYAEVPADPHRALELLERQESALYAAAAPTGMSPSGSERVYKKERRELEAARAALAAELLQRRIDDHAAGNVQVGLTGLHGAVEDALADPSSIRLELARIEDSIAEDPSAAIGKSKNLNRGHCQGGAH